MQSYSTILSQSSSFMEFNLYSLVSQDSLPIWGHRPVDRPSHSACLTTGRSCPVIRWTPLPTPSLTRSSLTPRSVRGWRRPCLTLLTTWTRCNRSNARKRTKKLKTYFCLLVHTFLCKVNKPSSLHNRSQVPNVIWWNNIIKNWRQSTCFVFLIPIIEKW